MPLIEKIDEKTLQNFEEKRKNRQGLLAERDGVLKANKKARVCAVLFYYLFTTTLFL
ncbi:hypothetical protein B4096_0073 [Heyndrickxia coagulans]|nr:hypothetical protein B4096_0073 [Heyndrickxia coagulans]